MSRARLEEQFSLGAGALLRAGPARQPEHPGVPALPARGVRRRHGPRTARPARGVPVPPGPRDVHALRAGPAQQARRGRPHARRPALEARDAPPAPPDESPATCCARAADDRRRRPARSRCWRSSAARSPGRRWRPGWPAWPTGGGRGRPPHPAPGRAGPPPGRGLPRPDAAAPQPSSRIRTTRSCSASYGPAERRAALTPPVPRPAARAAARCRPPRARGRRRPPRAPLRLGGDRAPAGRRGRVHLPDQRGQMRLHLARLRIRWMPVSSTRKV